MSIYQSLPPGYAGPSQKIGETHFWDAFVSPDTNKAVGRVYVGQDITDYIMGLAGEAAKMTTFAKNWESQAGNRFDVKDVYPGHKGSSYHGFLFNGRYMTLRAVGKVLAGINAKTHGEDFEDFMKGAGAYQQGGLLGAARHSLPGKTYGGAPYFGEHVYTGSRVRFGYDLSTGLTHTPPEPEVTLPGP